MEAEKTCEEYVQSLEELNETAESQKTCMAQISLAVNLSDTVCHKYFSHTLSVTDEAGEQHADISITNQTGSTLHHQFWRLVLDLRPCDEQSGSTNHRGWALCRPWRSGDSVDFRLRLPPLQRAAVSLACNLVFSVPSRYAVDESEEVGDDDRTALVALPVFATTVDELHALAPVSAVSCSAAPLPAAEPLVPQLDPPQPVEAPPIELGVAVAGCSSAADWLRQVSRDGGCEARDAELEGRLWGEPVTVAASEPAALSLLTVRCARLSLSLRLQQALHRRLSTDAAAGATVRVPSHVLTRLRGLLERVRSCGEDEPARLLELWAAAQRAVMYRLPHVPDN